jgi:hypothetical protein
MNFFKSVNSSWTSSLFHISFSTLWRTQNLWFVVDQLRRNQNWRFTNNLIDKGFNLYTVISVIYIVLIYREALVDQDLLSIHTAWSDTLHSVGIPWRSDQLVAQKSSCTTHNTHNRQTLLPPLGFEPATPPCVRPQTHALNPTATGIIQISICEQ